MKLGTTTVIRPAQDIFYGHRRSAVVLALPFFPAETERGQTTSYIHTYEIESPRSKQRDG